MIDLKPMENTGIAVGTVGIVVQARANSSRLPRKVLADLHGRPLLARVVERLQQVVGADRLIVATTDQPSDDAVAEVVEGLPDVDVFRGPENDVLARFAAAAAAFHLDAVARVTGDCPLIDPEVIDLVIDRFADTADCAYASICRPRTWPHGFDVEVVSRKALDAADREAQDPFDREHVLVHVFTRPERFVSINLEAPDPSHRDLRLTVDYPQDLEFVRAVYDDLYPANPRFRLADILDLLARRPELLVLQQDVPADESITDASQRNHPRAVSAGWSAEGAA